ncbi:hypothetical protein QUF88_14330 [Bacillus sp. DX1.1]|uniref:WD40/YVTN/BNR-like repeat-containing protein n=1 Tax=unclassified Bacillus (in: firmicutes) TaxID=185979 RepID=UPI00256FFB94|nr:MULTISPECIES: hypothetical protein [unclassified Bacillus (in: firmicutes)]MDM5154952.1 hypothetical protein [Bacillus sp. DX1.1]WJE83817.1 hypothetical protein QRE67_11825 [Bacillus sp. DX3.1]
MKKHFEENSNKENESFKQALIVIILFVVEITLLCTMIYCTSEDYEEKSTNHIKNEEQSAQENSSGIQDNNTNNETNETKMDESKNETNNSLDDNENIDDNTIKVETTESNLAFIGRDIFYQYVLKMSSKEDGNEKWQGSAQVVDQMLVTEKENNYSVAIKFKVDSLQEKNKYHAEWDATDNEGEITDNQWIIKFNKVNPYTYTFLSKEKAPATLKWENGLNDSEIENIKIKKHDKNYMIENSILKVTYDGKKPFRKVPVDIDQFMREDGRVNEDELQEGSYYITPAKTAFVHGGHHSPVKVTMSDDEGKTWETVTVGDDIDNRRLSFIGFTSKENGYIVITGDRTMSFETNIVYQTTNGGKSWMKMGSTYDLTQFFATGVSFATDQIGFITFKDSGGDPDVYRTEDGGKTWAKLDIKLPNKYHSIFTSVMPPTFAGSKGTLLVSQEEGRMDREGKMARFVSEDFGATWTFEKVVNISYEK